MNEVGSRNAEVGKEKHRTYMLGKRYSVLGTWYWRLGNKEVGSGKSDPASFCCLQNYAAAINAEVGKGNAAFDKLRRGKVGMRPSTSSNETKSE